MQLEELRSLQNEEFIKHDNISIIISKIEELNQMCQDFMKLYNKRSLNLMKKDIIGVLRDSDLDYYEFPQQIVLNYLDMTLRLDSSELVIDYPLTDLHKEYQLVYTNFEDDMRSKCNIIEIGGNICNTANTEEFLTTIKDLDNTELDKLKHNLNDSILQWTRHNMGVKEREVEYNYTFEYKNKETGEVRKNFREIIEKDI